MVQQHRPWQFHVLVGEGQLDVGQQLAGPALRHQERSVLVGQHGPGDTGVDEANPLRQWIDPEGHPGQIQEGQSRERCHLDPTIGP